VADALAAAVAGLPLQQLDSIDWRGMRFNDDLATRLPWLPPIAGPRHLVVLLWWEAQATAAAAAAAGGAAGSFGSVGAQWWRQVAAAESDAPQAAALRAAMMAAACQRWLLPHLLHAAMHALDSHSSNTSSAPQASDGSGSALQSLLQQYAGTLGCSSVRDLQQQLVAWCGDGGSGQAHLPVSRQLQLLDAALFLLAAHLQEAPDAGSSGTATTPQPAQLLSRALQRLQQQLGQQLSPGAAYAGCLLPGSTLSAAALLVHESCTWLLCCLEVRVCSQLRQAKLHVWLQRHQSTQGVRLSPLALPIL
jgi:hypothetical protein